ncbi:hypothetical protein DFP72DRAFT_866024 [Ephemerocybe angulata]|uniref:F-box domain-containing protein n=1 Tax=Ephemerocybe angulata TaxID=980116 RepID=A0A8H6IJT1_9AGAR|nr:hypothetical protein DFP72DRAFT_866024 [Tulosesus angulatus]
MSTPTFTPNDLLDSQLVVPPVATVLHSLARDRGSDSARRETLERHILGLEAYLRGYLPAYIRSLKFHYNNTTLAGRLPPEILCMIFLSYRSLIRNGSTPWKDQLIWVRLTHVCQTWRSVALDCLALWSDLCFKTPRFTELMLSRSKDAPLTVIFDMSTIRLHEERKWNSVLLDALSQTCRLRTVVLVANGPRQFGCVDISSILDKFTGYTKLPMLEEFSISGGAKKLHDEFLEAGATMLKRVQIRACSFNWAHLPLTNLTHLRLERNTQLQQDCLPAQIFIMKLVRMRTLQVLELVDFLPKDDYPAFGPDEILPVPLPQLKSLELHDSASAVISFIQMTRIPKAASIVVVFKDCKPQSRPPSAEIVDEFLLALDASWKDRPSLPSRLEDGVLDLWISDFSEKRANSPRLEFWFQGYQTPPELSIGFATHEVPLTKILVNVKKRLNLSSVITLRIDNCWSMRESAYAKVLSKLPHVENVTIKNSSFLCFLNVLLKDLALLEDSDSESTDEGTGDTYLTPRFPALWFLECCDYDFKERGFKTRDVIEGLIGVLTLRGDDYCIMDLHFRKCRNVWEENFEEVKEAFPEQEIDWDCDEDQDADSEDEEESEADS